MYASKHFLIEAQFLFHLSRLRTAAYWITATLVAYRVASR